MGSGSLGKGRRLLQEAVIRGNSFQPAPPEENSKLSYGSLAAFREKQRYPACSVETQGPLGALESSWNQKS